MLRPCPALPAVPVERLSGLDLSAQVDWWRMWSLATVERYAECARAQDLWSGWWADGVPAKAP